MASASPNLAFNYDLTTESAPLFTPKNEAYFTNPASYKQTYHLNEEDESSTTQPIFRLDFSHNFDPTDTGLGFNAGAQHRDLTQTYSYNQYRLNPTVAPTLAQIGTLGSPSLYDGYGQSILTVNPGAVDAYIAGNPGNYTRNATDGLTNTVNNYNLDEEINDGYVQLDYRTQHLFAAARPALRVDPAEDPELPARAVQQHHQLRAKHHQLRLRPIAAVVQHQLHASPTANRARRDHPNLGASRICAIG